LFFIALEDIYGEQPIRRALTQIRSLLRGQQITYPDIRAALEDLTNKDLTPMFRAWVYNVGIPAEFREKYENAEAGKN
jgi:aminopeptidase N